MFSSLAGTVVLVISLFSSVHGAAIPSHDNDVHEHDTRSALPALWYHDESHPAHALFRRQATTASSFPQVGSAAWASAYPPGTPVASSMPQAWIDALNVAVQANKIPNIPQSVLNSAGAPAYNGVNPSDPSVCSGTYGCRIPGTIYDAPAGVMGLGFDDGPLPVSHYFPFRLLFQTEFDFPSSPTYTAIR
jgi:chitin deacetylase